MASDILHPSRPESPRTLALTATRAADATVRRATPNDRAALYRFLASLSPRSTIQRFHGAGFRASEDMLDRLLRCDGSGVAVVAVGAVGAVVAEGAGVVVVGHAMWAPATE